MRTRKSADSECSSNSQKVTVVCLFARYSKRQYEIWNEGYSTGNMAYCQQKTSPREVGDASCMGRRHGIFVYALLGQGTFALLGFLPRLLSRRRLTLSPRNPLVLRPPHGATGPSDTLFRCRKHDTSTLFKIQYIMVCSKYG